MTKLTFRVTAEDEAVIVAVREHLRRTKSPWVSRSDTVRFALRAAEEKLQAAANSARPYA